MWTLRQLSRSHLEETEHVDLHSKPLNPAVLFCSMLRETSRPGTKNERACVHVADMDRLCAIRCSLYATVLSIRPQTV